MKCALGCLFVKTFCKQYLKLPPVFWQRMPVINVDDLTDKDKAVMEVNQLKIEVKLERWLVSCSCNKVINVSVHAVHKDTSKYIWSPNFCDKLFFNPYEGSYTKNNVLYQDLLLK